MARKKANYLNSPIGQEARWEDKESRKNLELRLQGQDAYDAGYDATSDLLGDGTPHDEIRRWVIRPTALSEVSADQPVSLQRHLEESNEIAKTLAVLHEEGCGDALKGTPKRKYDF